MLAAAKTAQKNQKKQKQRLIRKAGGLSAEDLERIAVLKRCGLYADDDLGGDGEGSQAPAIHPDEEPILGPKGKRPKLSEVVQNIEGAEVVLQAMGQKVPKKGGAAPSSLGTASSGAASSSGNSDNRPRGMRLFRMPSKAPSTRPEAEDEQRREDA